MLAALPSGLSGAGSRPAANCFADALGKRATANCEHRLPRLIASQLLVEAPPDRIAADSIVRLASSFRTMNLGSIDMRRLRNDYARAATGLWEWPHRCYRPHTPRQAGTTYPDLVTTRLLATPRQSPDQLGAGD